MITVHKPPVFPRIDPYQSIFLGGSIEMGNAIDWQSEFIEKAKSTKLGKSKVYNWNILNPRRDDWDNSWTQSIENPQFFQQVEWELTYLERCHYRVFYFAENTLSPITLLELGTHRQNNIYVCADPKYLRIGNIEIYCNKYNIPLYSSLDEIISKIFKI